MGNPLIATVAVCLPACLFTPAAIAKTERHQSEDINRSAQPVPHPKKTLATKGGTLLNSDATPEEAKKTAEATNRQILEKRRKR